jgi:ribosomal protein S6
MTEDTQKKEYEISFLLVQESGLGFVEKLIAKYGGEIFYSNPVTEMRLAYPIEKKTSAYFGFLHFRDTPESVNELRADLILQKEILRFLIITPPMPLKQERQERGKSYPASGEKQPPLEAPSAPALSNEDLEQKLEEILK